MRKCSEDLTFHVTQFFTEHEYFTLPSLDELRPQHTVSVLQPIPTCGTPLNTQFFIIHIGTYRLYFGVGSEGVRRQPKYHPRGTFSICYEAPTVSRFASIPTMEAAFQNGTQCPSMTWLKVYYAAKNKTRG